MERTWRHELIHIPETKDFLNIYRCKYDKVLHADWFGILDATRARLGCTAILKVLQDRPYAKILNNNSRVTGHYPGAIEWVGKVWFPEMYALGVRYFGWIYSPAFYTQLGTDEVISLSSKVEIQTFYDIIQAWQWISDKPDTIDIKKTDEALN